MCCDHRVTEVRDRHHEQPNRLMRIGNGLAGYVIGWDLRL